MKQFFVHEDKIIIGGSDWVTINLFKGYITVTQFSDGFIAAETRVSGEDLELLIKRLQDCK